MRREPAGPKVLLLTIPIVSLLPFIAAVGSWRPTIFGVLAFLFVAFTMMLGVVFFFPEATVIRAWEAHQRRRRVRAGNLDYETAYALVTRRTEKRAWRRRTVDWSPGLVHVIVQRSTDDRAYGKVARDWLRRGHDLALLNDALTIRLSPDVLRAHLTGKQPLDAAAVATLAALTRETRPHGGPTDDGPSGGVSGSLSLTSR